MDRVVARPAEAVADIGDGASIAIAGFGLSHRFPSSLIVALSERGSKQLTVYCNGLGSPGFPTAHLLAENHQLSRLVASFSARPGVRESEAEDQMKRGELAFEIVPPGTLVARMRAGGAGLAGIFHPVASGPPAAGAPEGPEFDRDDEHVLVAEARVTLHAVRTDPDHAHAARRDAQQRAVAAPVGLGLRERALHRQSARSRCCCSRPQPGPGHTE